QHSPPALVATFPPIEQISYEEGSGGYQSPCSAAAALTSALSSPGWIVAVRVTGSTAMSRISSVLSTMPPSTAVAPPDSPEPAPRGTTGTPYSVAQRMTFQTSCVDPARTAHIAVPWSGPRAHSWHTVSM